MSSNSPYGFPGDASRSQVPFNQAPNFDEEDKVPYDDLTGDDSQSNFKNSRYQTYTIEAPMGDHNRRPSFPLQMAAKQSYETSLDHDHSAYPPAAIPPEEHVSFWRRIMPNSLACRLFVLTVILETIVDLSIEGELLLRVHDELHSAEGQSENATTQMAEKSMQAYLVIFAMAHIFQLIMALHAVYTRNTLQFVFLIAFNGLFLLAAIVQIKEVQESIGPISAPGVTGIPVSVLTTIIPIVISLAEVAYIALGWKIYNEFGWQVFKFLGADRRIKKMYANYQVYECLVKFDVFFFAAFSVQFIYLVLQKGVWEYYVTCAALPLSLILLVEGHLAAKHENKLMMFTFMFGCVGAMVYFVYKLVKVLLFKNSDFQTTWKTLTVFAVLAILLLFATFVLSIMILQNFGRGLKTALLKKDNQHSTVHRRVQSTNLHRMSIN